MRYRVVREATNDASIKQPVTNCLGGDDLPSLPEALRISTEAAMPASGTLAEATA